MERFSKLSGFIKYLYFLSTFKKKRKKGAFFKKIRKNGFQKIGYFFIQYACLISIFKFSQYLTTTL